MNCESDKNIFGELTSEVRSVQINLKHSINATDNIIIFLGKNNIDIALIQEPWIRDNKVMGLDNPSFVLFYLYSTDVKPRSCILVKKHLSAFLIPNLCDGDTTVVIIENRNKPVIVVSTYFPHSKNSPPHIISSICRQPKFGNLVISCDSNSRNTLWGSSGNNERGEELLDFILNIDLNFCNAGNIPTFVFPGHRWEEVLDITFNSLQK